MNTVDTHGLRWRKSSRSGSQGGNCLEVAATATTRHVRDSKNPHGAILTVTPEHWHSFLHAIRTGHLT